MQLNPSSLPLSEYQPVLQLKMDAATLHQSMSIYYICSLNRPFCQNPACTCYRQQQEIKKLLDYINDGIMTLQEAAGLMEAGPTGRDNFQLFYPILVLDCLPGLFPCGTCQEGPKKGQ